MAGGFKYYTPRKRRARVGPEARLQIAVVEHLRLNGVRGLSFHHTCNAGKRSAAAGATLKRMGMLVGIADLVIDIPGQPAAYLELKAPNEKQEIEQIAFQAWCIDTGRRYGLADNINEALRILNEWGCFKRPPLALGSRGFFRHAKREQEGASAT